MRQTDRCGDGRRRTHPGLQPLLIASLCALALLAPVGASGIAPSAQAQSTLAQSTQAQTAPYAAACVGRDGRQYVCGPHNVEDIDQLPDRPLLVASSFNPPPSQPRLSLVDIATRTARSLPIDIAARPDPIYAACPAPLDPAKFSPHGLALKRTGDGQSLLYVVNHGGRESIEMFAIDARTADIRARWLGCVVLPEGASGNAVAPMDDGGFVATKFFDTREGPERPQFLARRHTSAVYRWSPGKGLSLLPGGEMVGDNGMVVSKDGAWVYVTSWVEKRVVRLPLRGSAPVLSATVDFMPDNLRWAPDGSILIGGQATDIEMLIACKHTRCPADWGIARLDPQTMAVSYLYWEKGTPEFAGATVAAEAGGKLWIGTFFGDRIAVVDIPTAPLHP